MASTRAKARVLRDVTNIGITALEELGGDDAPEMPTQRGGHGRSKPLKVEEKRNILPAPGNGQPGITPPLMMHRSALYGIWPKTGGMMRVAYRSLVRVGLGTAWRH